MILFVQLRKVYVTIINLKFQILWRQQFSTKVKLCHRFRNEASAAEIFRPTFAGNKFEKKQHPPREMLLTMASY